MSPGLVVVVGSINADLVVTVDRHPAPGETVLGGGGRILPGGKGANQAVAAARLGAPAAIIGAVGDDPNAGPATAGLRDSGVDLSAVATRSGPTGLAVVTVAADGENSIVVVPGANATVTPADVAAHVGLLADASVVLLQGELPRATVQTAARMAASAGRRVILNLAPAIELDPDVVRLADPLVVNEHEAGEALRLLGATPARAEAKPKAELNAEPNAEPNAEAEAWPEPFAGKAEAPVASSGSVAHAAALRRAGVPSVIVTMGAAGAVVVGGGGSEPDGVHVPAVTVPVRDTTGAGDAFVGALAAKLAAGEDLVAAVRVAVRVAAYSVQRDGAQPSYPTLGDPLP